MSGGDTHIVALLIMAIVLGVGALVATARAWRWAPLAGFAALLAGWLGGYCPSDEGTMWFWAGAAVIAFGINMLLPAQVSCSRVGVAYFTGGAIVGGILGMLSNTEAGIIVGSAAGLLLAAVAFSRLDAGKALGFPSKQFFNYLCAKGLPMVVTISMLAIVGIHLISMQLQ